MTGQHGVDDDLLALYFEAGRKLAPRKNGCPSVEHPRGHSFTNEYAELLWERRFYDGEWFKGSPHDAIAQAVFQTQNADSGGVVGALRKVFTKT